MITFTSREAFIAALEGRRQFWRDYDTDRTAQHVQDERAWLESARTKLRSRLTWSYEDFKKAERFSSAAVSLGEFPSCPVLMEHKLDNVLSVLAYTQSKLFRVDDKGTWAEAHKLLTWDPNAKTTVC